MTKELLNCPFCGGQAELHFFDSVSAAGKKWFYPRCNSCGSQFKDFRMNKTDAISKWNARPAIGQQSGWRGYIPKNDGNYWCYFSDNGPQSFNQGVARFKDGRWLTMWTVAAWQPLPSAPEPNKQEGE